MSGWSWSDWLLFIAVTPLLCWGFGRLGWMARNSIWNSQLSDEQLSGNYWRDRRGWCGPAPLWRWKQAHRNRARKEARLKKLAAEITG